MPRRLAALLALTLVLSAAAAPAALAQGENPFGPLPPAQPRETPPPAPVERPGDEDVSRETLFLIAFGVIAAFFGIGWAITRDARRALPADDRREVDRVAQQEGGRKHDRRAKQKARSKQKAARAARRTTRRRAK